MTDLGNVPKAYLMGRCGDDAAMARAVVRVLFQGHSYREVARQEKVAARSLQRRVRDVKSGLNRLVSGGHVDASELIAK